jgi:hypothetical protein
MRKIALVLLFLIGYASGSIAQELNCIVSVVATPTVQAQNSDTKIYESLQASIYEFMNSRKWTNYNFSQEEKIECTILITISDRSNDVFSGNIQVQSRRPIYKSSFNSVMLNLIDKDLQFTYTEYQPLNYNENTFTSNLTSVLAYYAYLIIGIDFDSYKLKGGTALFDKAQTIITNAQNASEKGWKAFENQKNRYWLIENLLNNIYGPIRECIYNYHRKGLDMMIDNAATAKTPITAGLAMLKNVHEEKPGSYLMQLFFNAKADEIVNIYSNANISAIDKKKVADICKEIDPTNSNKYNQITK